MRRAFVIFLILLFPLNVLALSLSVAAERQTGAIGHAPGFAPAADTAGTVGDMTLGDVDADEPPAGADSHDSVNEEGRARRAMLRGGPRPPPPPSRRGLAPVPPIKPPPVH